jgi:hypothetical protein
MQIKILIGFIVFVLAGCGDSDTINKHTGFMKLPFPSKNISLGQIVEVFTKPEKVEITYDSNFDSSKMKSSQGWSISVAESNKINVAVTAKIASILKPYYPKIDCTLTVEFLNKKTEFFEKNLIFKKVDSTIAVNASLKRHLVLYNSKGAHFNVITQIITGKIKVSVFKDSNDTGLINGAVLNQLNAEFDLVFNQDSSVKRIISEDDLIFGFHYDPNMINILYKEITDTLISE